MKAKTKVQNRDFIRVGRSKIQGRGVFAKRKIPRGTRIIEYAGDRIPKKDLLSDVENGLTSHKYVLSINDELSVDGERNGNEARFINHSCEPNCEVYVFDEVPYIYAMVEIHRWEELTFDYKLNSSFGRKLTKKEKFALFPCNCQSKKCRGTLLAK